MNNTSLQFRTPIWRDWHGQQMSVPPPLQRVAQAFINLQEERHVADYDSHEQWTLTDVQALVNTARSAFHDWLLVRADPLAGNYLLSMLLGKRR